MAGRSLASRCALDRRPVPSQFVNLGSLALSLAPALAGASRVLYLVRAARQARELPLVRSQEELAQARADEERAEQLLARREQELADLRDQGLQLRQFVRERAASSDYRGKLGVISQVRRDFEQLVALIPGGQDRAGQAAVQAALAQVPEVDRIVLYIDDLDRCPHEQVVEVLQAVHLLLAFRLFVVVVGVDSRWLRRSLLAHYDTLLEEPDSYLEKIFQIPFTMRPMTATTYRDLIGELAPSVRAEQPEKGASDKPTEAGPAGADSASVDGDEGETLAGADPAYAAAGISELAGPAPSPSPEALVITDMEREMLGRFGAIVRTPRAAKRLVNIYRMLRVSVPRYEDRAFLPDSEGGGEYQAVIVLLSILVGRPAQAHEVFIELMAADADADAWPVLAKVDGLADCLPKDSGLRETKVEPYQRWAPRVSRFSFRLTDMLPHGEPSA